MNSFLSILKNLIHSYMASRHMIMGVTVLSTYEDGNILEDVMLAVTNISPIDRPFMESIGKKKAYSGLHQWPEDTLATRASCATLEGATITGGTVVAPTRKSNYTQYCTKAWQVTHKEAAVKGAGIDNMFMSQRTKKMKELINGIEYDLINGVASAGTTTTTATMAGLLSFLTTNTSTVATGSTLTEAYFINLFKLAWDQGGSPTTVFVNATMKKAISNFSLTTGTLQRQISADKKELNNVVDYYNNDFSGRAEILISRDMPTGTNNCAIAVVDTSFFAAAYLIPIEDVEVGQTTYGKLGALHCDVTLECRGQAGNAKVLGYNA